MWSHTSTCMHIHEWAHVKYRHTHTQCQSLLYLLCLENFSKCALDQGAETDSQKVLDGDSLVLLPISSAGSDGRAQTQQFKGVWTEAVTSQWAHLIARYTKADRVLQQHLWSNCRSKSLSYSTVTWHMTVTVLKKAFRNHTNCYAEFYF